MLMQIDAPLPKSFTEELSVLPSKEKVYRFQTVFTVGHPHGWGNSGAEGIVSHPNRTQGKFKADQIQIDMAINGGNSGGPLLDEDLNLIGVVSWGEFGGVEENPSQININFAISYKTINKFLEGV
jgi:S1-C subfamily serine protease